MRVYAVVLLSGLLAATMATGAENPAPSTVVCEITKGPFEPAWDSLKKYECPEWFRDAKFGIWAHWGAQCQPEMGDWYARSMYLEGSTDYKFHCEHYGHPSVFGFKDICHIWKADQFDPEKLIARYKQAGAQYFVMMANHHCNFDNWNSKYQPWNSVAIGPKKDLVGMWEKATRKAGLRFGVTVHAGRAWTWYEVAQGCDTNGPLKGVPYDGKLTKADGKGKWWDGLDPQDLYAQNHKRGEKPDTAYSQKFYNRVIDLIDSYKPDLLYFDDGVLPLRGVDETIGLSIAAHLYNSSAKWHSGRNEAVMNTKGLNEEQRQCLIWDIERGVSTRVEPFVWQTDTCIGSWHYNRPIFERHGYKTTTQVVHMLLDIVSKNGNLLLNIPVRGNGTIDEDEVAFLEGMAQWMAVNNECIYGTRPWKIFGEGPSAVEKPEAGRHGGASDVRRKGYTAADFRFTTKAGALYAVALAWPAEGQLTVRTLAAGAPGIKGDVTGVELLGCKEQLTFKRDATGLVVTVPAQKPCDHAFALKITGLDLAGAEPQVPRVEGAELIRADRSGAFVLDSGNATLHGKRIKAQGHGETANLGYWDDFTDYASWAIHVAEPGKYTVVARTASLRAANEFAVEVGAQKLTGTAPQTATWNEFADVKLGTVDLSQPGKVIISVRPAGDSKKWKAINLASLKLTASK